MHLCFWLPLIGLLLFLHLADWCASISDFLLIGALLFLHLADDMCAPVFCLSLCGAHPFQEDVEWCESNTTAAWAEDVLGVLSTVRQKGDRLCSCDERGHHAIFYQQCLL